AHGAGEDSEAANFGRLVAGFEQRLQAEADAQERHAGADAVDQGIANSELVERAHHLSEMADAGKEDFRGGAQAFGITYEGVGAAELGEGVLDRAEVAGAVVEDGDHKLWKSWRTHSCM